MRRLIHGSRWFSSTDGLGRNERNTIEDPDESNLPQQQAAKRGIFTGGSTTTSSKGSRSVEEDYIWVVSVSWNGIRFEKRYSYSCPATDENNKNNTNNSQHSYTRGTKRMCDFAATPSSTKLLVAVIAVLTLYCVVSIVDEGRPLEVGKRTDNRQQLEQQGDHSIRRDRNHRDSNSNNIPATVNAATAASIDPIDIWLRSPAFEAKQFAPSWMPKNEEGRRANHPSSSSSSSSDAEAPHSAEASVPLSSSSVLIPLVFTNPTRWYLRAPATFGGGDDTELLENTPLPTFGVGDEVVGVAVGLSEEMLPNSTATTIHTLLTTDDELGAAAAQHNNNNIMNEEESEPRGLLIVFPPKVAERPFFPYTLDRINEGRHAIFSQLADMALRYYDAPALLEAYCSVATNQKRLGSQRREERRKRNDLRGRDDDDDACAAVLVNEIAGHDANVAAALGREKHRDGKRFCRDRQHQLPIEELRGDEDELPLPHRW